MSYACYACHGLGIIQPINQVAEWLNANTPEGVHFTVVGGADPRVWQHSIEEAIAKDVGAGKEVIWVGHSMGAALGFYLPKLHPHWRFRYIATVDPMCWASNLSDSPPWSPKPQHPGRWMVYDDVQRQVNIRTSMYPGGGVLVNPSPPKWTDHHFPQYDHIGVITHDDVKALILGGLLEAIK